MAGDGRPPTGGGNHFIVGTKGVTYGLQLRRPPGNAHVQPGLHARSTAARPPAAIATGLFDEEEDEEDDEGDGGEARARRELAVAQRHASRNELVARVHAEARAADPSVFDYDAYLGEKQERKKEERQMNRATTDAVGQRGESRYIGSLLRAAERRNREQDLAYERRLARERESESAMYAGKEEFVTAGYKRKLAEDAALQRELDEEDRRNAGTFGDAAVGDGSRHAEDVEDAKRAGFYRNVLDMRAEADIASAAGHRPVEHEAGSRKREPSDWTSAEHQTVKHQRREQGQGDEQGEKVREQANMPSQSGRAAPPGAPEHSAGEQRDPVVEGDAGPEGGALVGDKVQSARERFLARRRKNGL